MDNRLKLAAGAVLIIGAGLLALVLTGVWPGPSAADREQARTLYTQAQTQLQSGDQDAALEALNTSIALDPQNDALRDRAGLLVARAEYDAALRDLDKVIGRGGGLAANYSLRCWLRARGENLNGARDDCDRAIEIDATLASAYGNRGLVGLRQSRNREARDDFNAALRIGGNDGWVEWRLFGRGVANWGLANEIQGRQDVEQALRSTPGVAAQFAEFSVGGEIMSRLEDAAYSAATSPRTLITLQQFLYVYPNGAHAAEARQHVAEIYAWIAQDESNGRATLPGFSFAQGRGAASPDDTFGAIAVSRSTFRVAFVTDYASATEAQTAGAAVCNTTSVRDCEAFAFRNVCAALALSRTERQAKGMAWAYSQDDAVRGALADCRERGGRNCVPVHSQCTPTRDDTASAASPAQ